MNTNFGETLSKLLVFTSEDETSKKNPFKRKSGADEIFSIVAASLMSGFLPFWFATIGWRGGSGMFSPLALVPIALAFFVMKALEAKQMWWIYALWALMCVPSAASIFCGWSFSMAVMQVWMMSFTSSSMMIVASSPWHVEDEEIMSDYKQKLVNGLVVGVVLGIATGCL